MSTPYGFGGGFLEGLAGSYATAQRQNLEMQMAQRKNIWDTLQSFLPGARQEAQVKIAQKLAGLVATPLNKKVDKSITDWSDLMESPAGYAPQAPQPVTVGQDTSQSWVGAASQPSGFEPVPLTGAGMPRVPGGRFPPSGPSTGTARVPTDVQPPEVNTNIVPGGGEGMNVGMTPGLTPPPYSPWYSPEEQAQLKAHEAAMAGSETIRQEQEVRRQMGEALGLKGNDLARYSMGQPPLVIRFQDKYLVDPEHPNQAMPSSYDSMSGQYYYQGTMTPIPNPIPWTGAETSVGDLTPDPESKTGYSRKIYDKNTHEVVRLEKGAVPNAAYAISYGATTTPTTQIDPNTGVETTQNVTRGTVSQRVAPGQPAPKLTPPPAAVSAPITVGNVRVPKTVIDAQHDANIATQRLNTMSKLESRAKGGDQQAQIAILAAHMGMTAGIVPGVRIGATFWNEAEESAPWITRLLAGVTKIDPASGERVVISPLTGIKLAPEQIDQMIANARLGVENANENLGTVKKQATSGYGIVAPPAARAANTATKAQVQQYATKYKLTYEKAKQEFIDDGVTVDEGR